MKTIRDFAPSDRYLYDFGRCSVSNGFAQVDTSQDAHYFGTWANPEKLQVICYCEGDVTVETAETKEEFVQALRRLKDWPYHEFKGIDPMENKALTERFKDLGLGDLLH